MPPAVSAAAMKPVPARSETPALAGARERVLAAAVELFARNGYDGTSVSQVLATAVVAKGGFYHHFASKQDLLYEVYGDLITRQLAGMERILALDLPPAETLRALITDLVVSTADSYRQALVFSRESSRLDDARAQEHRRQRRRYDDAVRRLVADAQRSGAFARVASPQIVTYTIFGVINELPLWYRPGGRKRPAQIAAELSEFVLAALTAGTSSQGER